MLSLRAVKCRAAFAISIICVVAIMSKYHDTGDIESYFLEHLNGSLKAYMYALSTNEQLTMSTAHFHQFLNLVNDWNFTGVEPFAYGSSLFALRSLHEKDGPHSSMAFSTLFNSSEHDSYLGSCLKRNHSPLFEPMDEFLRRSYRNIVLVYFAKHKTNFGKTFFKELDEHVSERPEPFLHCSSAAQKQGMYKLIEGLLRRETAYVPPSYYSTKALRHSLGNFNIIQAFCVNPTVRNISLVDLKHFVLNSVQLRRREPRQNATAEFSVIFMSWQGRFTHPGLVRSDVKYINKCRLPFSQPFHSNYVVATAEKYLKSRKFGHKPYLSVHVRFEKLYIYALREKKDIRVYLDCCMNRLNMLLSLLREKFNISAENTLLHWDYSPYGTRKAECPLPHGDCSDIADKGLDKINIKPSYFEPKEYGVSPHLALASLVEMRALIGGRALVTVGEGSYQFTIVESFVNSHQNADHPEQLDNLHYGHLCIPQEKLNEFSSRFEQHC